MNKSNTLKILIILIILILIIASVYIFLSGSSDKKNNNSEDYIDEDLAYRNVKYNGVDYIFNDDITTILFMGIDQREAVVVDGYEGTGGRSDSLILLILNENNQTVKMLSISRDTMTDVAIYDAFGDYFTTTKLQITMQYAYGDGADKSCRLTRAAVSKLLFGIPVDYYLSMNMDGISAITDALGGVEVEFLSDYTEIDVEYKKGTTVSLNGEQAEAFVRYRDTNTTGSNDERMERQSLFIDALVKKLQNKMADNSLYYKNLFDEAGDYIVMDLDADTIDLLSQCSLIDTEYKVPGETIEGDMHDEYIVNNEELKDLIISLFYKLN